MNKRVQYDADYKRNAILYAEESGNRAAARHLNISESVVRRWRKDRDFIFSNTSTVKGARKPKTKRNIKKITSPQNLSEEESIPFHSETVCLESEDVQSEDNEQISLQDIITQDDDDEDASTHKNFVNLQDLIQRNKANAKPIARNLQTSPKNIKKNQTKIEKLNLVKWTKPKRYPEVDKEVINFMILAYDNRLELTEEMVRNKANEIANSLGIEFVSNHNWYENLKYHFNLFYLNFIQSNHKSPPQDTFDDTQFLIEYDDGEIDNEYEKPKNTKNKKVLRRPYEAKLKRKVILFAEEYGNRAAQRHYGINESVVRGWRKERDYIFSCNPTAKRAGGFREGRFPQIEKAVIKSMKEKFRKGEEVTEQYIRTIAREVADSLGIDENEFKCSHGWYKKVIRRNKMSSKISKSEKSSDNEESLFSKDEFNSSIITEVELHSNHEEDNIDPYNLKIEILSESVL
jgi:transposase-like protein